MAGREKSRHAFFLGGPCQFDPRLVLAQADVAKDQVDMLAFEQLERLMEIVDRGDDLVTGVAEHIFIVEGGQRLVLDDEDPLDDLLTLSEQHPGTPMTSPSQRTTKRPVPPRRKSGRSVSAA